MGMRESLRKKGARMSYTTARSLMTDNNGRKSMGHFVWQLIDVEGAQKVPEQP